jgi:hypothetical protein
MIQGTFNSVDNLDSKTDNLDNSYNSLSIKLSVYYFIYTCTHKSRSSIRLYVYYNGVGAIDQLGSTSRSRPLVRRRLRSLSSFSLIQLSKNGVRGIIETPH